MSIGRAFERTSHARENEEEITIAVCDLFIRRGLSTDEVVEQIRERYRRDIKREAVYKLVRKAASRGWIKFVSPRENPLAKSVSDRFPWLRRIDVLNTPVFGDVAYQAATAIMELLRSHRGEPNPKNEVHIGFAGGYSMRTVARELAEMLKQPSDDLPKTLVFHALVSGYDINYPATDPNAFFTFFTDRAIQHDIGFVALHAPPIIRPDQWDKIKALPGVKEAVERTSELHILVSSGSSLQDPDGMLRRYYPEAIIRQLERDNAVGDMLWQPLSDKGPINSSSYEFCPLALVGLPELHSKIQKGLQVLLTLGPCGRCGRLKSDILHTVLNQPEHLITHLTVDSRSVRDMFERGQTSG